MQAQKFFLALFLGALVAMSTQAADYVAGKHYKELENPGRTRDPEKVEVIEFFWYGCNHCYRMEAPLHSWLKTVPADVDFWRSPAVFSKRWEPHARAYYVAKLRGVLDKSHGELFNAIHVGNQKLASKEQLAKFFANYGMTPEEFTKVYDSFSVSSQIKQASARVRGYQLSGVPGFVVAGKYLVSGEGLRGGQGEMLKVVDYLIEKERKAK